MKISLKIVTPERIVYEDVVDSISTQTQMGEVTILPGHVPLVANLKAGETRLVENGEERFMATSTGFLEVRSGQEVVILADTAERMEELDVEKAKQAIEKAKERAKQLMEAEHDVDEVQFAKAAAAIEREMARHKVARKKKHRGKRPSSAS